MERSQGLWHFKEKSADRLWHKSAIGKPVKEGPSHEYCKPLCVNHRNIDPQWKLIR